MSARRSSFWTGPAAMAAGLLFLSAGLLRAEDPPPGRSVAPEPVAAGSQALVDLGQRVDGLALQAGQQKAHLEDLDHRVLSGAQALAEQAASAKEGAAALKDAVVANQRVEQRLASAEQSLAAAQARLQFQDEGQARLGVSLSAQGARLDALAPELAALKLALASAQDALQASAKDYAATRAKLEERSDKLDSLSELLTVLKRGLENDDEELVEVKQALKRLEPAPAPDSGLGNLAWWDGVLTWKYLPAVATGLGLVATAVALSHR